MIQESRLQQQYHTGWPVNLVSTLLCCSFLLHSIILSESQPFSARSVSYILLVFPIESHLIEKQPLLKGPRFSGKNGIICRLSRYRTLFQYKPDPSKSFSCLSISLGVKNYQINGFFWSKICVIKSQKSLGNKKVNKCNEYC